MDGRAEVLRGGSGSAGRKEGRVPGSAGFPPARDGGFGVLCGKSCF